MDALYELKMVLEDQIGDMARKKDLTPTMLDSLDKMVDIVKDIETICAMKDYSYDDGYSGRYPRWMTSYGMGDISYDVAPQYSYRRGRDMNTGRYVSRDMPHYYMDGRNMKEDLKMDLRRMMDNAKTEKERIAIQNLLEQWKE